MMDCELLLDSARDRVVFPAQCLQGSESWKSAASHHSHENLTRSHKTYGETLGRCIYLGAT